MSIRELTGEPLPQPLFKVAQVNTAARLESDIDDGLLRPTSPKKDRVDGIGRTLHTHIAQTQVEVVCPSFFIDRVQHMPDQIFRNRNARSVRCVNTQTELRGCRRREELSWNPWCNQPDDQEGDDSIADQR